MTASDELRVILRGVADGAIDIEAATTTLTRWVVYAMSVSANIDIQKLAKDAAEDERAWCTQAVRDARFLSEDERGAIVGRIEAKPLLTPWVRP